MSESTQLVLKAPISGVVVPLDQVPDPVFAGRMVGDGISIDPASATLLAPCDGRIVQMHSAGHAVTLASSQGVELLMHIGLDTVQLKGRGFVPRVRVGDAVSAGDVLIEFDADYVATNGRSLMTELIVTSSDRVAAMHGATGFVNAGTDTILTLTLAGKGRSAGIAAADAVRSDALVIVNPSGLHARPAAVLASRAKQFTADIRLRRGDDEVNARSVVAILGLEVARGDAVHIVASGPDAVAAVKALSQLVRDGLGEAAGDAPSPAQEPALTVVASRSDDPNVLAGVPASPGLAVGRILQLRHEQVNLVEDAADARAERQALDAALEHAKAELDVLSSRLQREGAGDKAAIFAAHRELLDDPDLLEIAGVAMSRGKGAAFAWHMAVTRHADRLAHLKSELLAARANDLRDVGRRVLQKLTGVEDEPLRYEGDTILVAEELTPSDMARLDRTRVLGLCTTTGGASSHVAIIARSLELPLVAGIDPRVLDLANGVLAVVDGSKGVLRVHPTSVEVVQVHELLAGQTRERLAHHARALEPATTLDGHRVEIEANIGSVAEAEQAARLGADGVGLFRTEFLFLDRATAPTEDEQYRSYSDAVRALGRGRRLVLRTLDVGGDKPLAYLPLPREDNPFLGERGVRVMLNRPELLRAQLRAILRAAGEGDIAVMFPMIATLDEWRAVRDVLEDERRKLGARRIETGIMVEVPSAAVTADRFAAEVDFFSIGTNDLTQYTLAMDRGHPRLASQVDGLAPAVLRLIDQTVRAARPHGRRTAVCGGIASDPQAVPLLVGLGIGELSVAVPSIPVVKAQIRGLRLEDCRALAQQALACATAADVRALVSLEAHA